MVRCRCGPGNDSLASSVQSLESEGQTPTPSRQTLDPRLSDPRRTAGERRQLTVMFCDLVGSTALSEQLDPEELREVVRTLSRNLHRCDPPVRRTHCPTLGRWFVSLLWLSRGPRGRCAQRAVRTGLEIIAALPHLNEQTPVSVGARRHRAPTALATTPLQVRIGIHTGLVVIGEIGSGEKREMLALGETPNIAARVQG